MKCLDMCRHNLHYVGMYKLNLRERHRNRKRRTLPQVLRIWARTQDEAELMVSEGADLHGVDLDVETFSAGKDGAVVLPFLTGARLVRCMSCTPSRLMYAADYIAADHACIPAGRFVGDELDGQVTA